MYSLTELEPLWKSAMNLSVGCDHDINIQRMVMLFNTTGAKINGVCVWSLIVDDKFFSNLNNSNSIFNNTSLSN